MQEVRRNRHIWTPKLDQRDRILRTGESAKQQEQRRKQLDEFQRFKEKNIKRLAIQKQQRIQLRGGVDTDSLFEQQPSNVGEEVVEFLIKTEEVEYKPQSKSNKNIILSAKPKRFFFLCYNSQHYVLLF